MNRVIKATISCFLFYFVSTPIWAERQNFRERTETVLSLLTTDKAKAEELALDILVDAQKEESDIGLVRSNYYLGYLQKRKGDLGKAVIYYLEGIRYANDADYEGVEKDLVGLFKNTGTIFMKFKNYELAEKYYEQASELASTSGLINEYVRLMYAHARLLKSQGNVEQAIVLLESTFDNFNSVSNKSIANIYPRKFESCTRKFMLYEAISK